MWDGWSLVLIGEGRNVGVGVAGGGLVGIGMKESRVGNGGGGGGVFGIGMLECKVGNGGEVWLVRVGFGEGGVWARGFVTFSVFDAVGCGGICFLGGVWSFCVR